MKRFLNADDRLAKAAAEAKAKAEPPVGFRIKIAETGEVKDVREMSAEELVQYQAALDQQIDGYSKAMRREIEDHGSRLVAIMERTMDVRCLRAVLEYELDRRHATLITSVS